MTRLLRLRFAPARNDTKLYSYGIIERTLERERLFQVKRRE
ncbi:MAG: hypothetical protein ACP5TY_00525 [Thermodesulforhabdaceae bacterium]